MNSFDILQPKKLRGYLISSFLFTLRSKNCWQATMIFEIIDRLEIFEIL